MLKHSLAILLLLSFAYRPVFQVAEISYYQFNIKYIVENYCVNKDKPELHCNGKCYLMQQLNKASSQKGKTTAAIFETSFLPVFFQPIQDYAFSFTTEELFYKSFGYFSALKNSQFYSEIDPPPKI